jgi:hypothetical protein
VDDEDDQKRIRKATYAAFDCLISAAVATGLRITPEAALNYLRDRALTRDFERACRKILESLQEDS